MPAASTSETFQSAIPKQTISPLGFLFVLTASALFLTTIIFAASTFTDPSRYLFGSPVPQIWPNTTRKKIDLFRQYSARQKVTGLMFGSSRSELMQPALLDRVTGLRFFNAAVDDPSTDQFLALYRLFRKMQGGPPKVMVLGLETLLLGANAPIAFDMTSNYELNHELDPRLMPLWHYSKLYAIHYFRMQAMRDLQTSLRNWRAPKPPLTLFHPDGLAEDAKGFNEATYVLTPAQLRTGLEAILIRYREFTGLSQARIDRFRALLEETSADGVRVVIWLTPLHPSLRAALDKLPLVPPAERQARATVDTLAAQYHAGIVDLSDLRSYGGDPAQWLDAVHVTPPESAREEVKVIAALDNIKTGDK